MANETAADVVGVNLSRIDLETDILGALYWVRKGRRYGDQSTVEKWTDQLDLLLDNWPTAAPI